MIGEAVRRVPWLCMLRDLGILRDGFRHKSI
jgi:hypothetical protein